MSRRHGTSLWLAALAVAILVGCATTGSEVTEVQRLQARAAYERGYNHFVQREAAPALAALQEAVSIDPTVANYRDLLGLVYLQLRRPDMGLEQFLKAVELDPKLADAHFHMGTALAEMQRWEEAVASYQKAIALPTLGTPDYAHQNLGLAYYHLKRYREAEQSLHFAISLAPKLQAAYYNLGLVLMAESRRDEAKAVFRRARELEPDSPFGRAALDRLKALGEEG